MGSTYRQRDILPLPNYDKHIFDSNISTNIKRRLRRKNKSLDWANECVDVLNRVGSDGAQVSSGFVPQNSASAQASQHILETFCEMPGPPPDTSPEGALTELLESAGFYSHSRADVLPYEKEHVSWPDCGSRPVEIVGGLLPTDRSNLINWETELLRDSKDYKSHIANSKVVRPYVDPLLANDPKLYGDFLLRLNLAGMLKWRVSNGERSSLGFFFVRKKDGSLRLIFDTRKLNLKFRDPPKTPLPSSAAFSQLEAPEDSDMVIASGDIKNAFYILHVPCT